MQLSVFKSSSASLLQAALAFSAMFPVTLVVVLFVAATMPSVSGTFWLAYVPASIFFALAMGLAAGSLRHRSAGMAVLLLVYVWMLLLPITAAVAYFPIRPLMTPYWIPYGALIRLIFVGVLFMLVASWRFRRTTGSRERRLILGLAAVFLSFLFFIRNDDHLWEFGYRHWAKQALDSHHYSTARDDSWLKDLRWLVTELPERHPNWFYRMDRVSFQKETEELARRIPELTDQQMVLSLKRLTALAQDAHTDIRIRDGMTSLPVTLYSFSDGLFITGAEDAYRQMIGAKVIRIGNTDAAEALEKVSVLIPNENRMQRLKAAPQLLVMQDVLDFLGLTDGGHPVFTLEKTGTQFSVSFNPEAQPQNAGIADDTINRGEPQPDVVEKDGTAMPLYRQNRDVNYWYTRLPEKQLIYFAYNQARELKDRPIRPFLNELKSTIQANPNDTLLIDLRNNGGGSSSLLEPLIGYLASEGPARTGKVYAAIGRNTFSSAVLNAVALRDEAGVILIGEPTGGRPNHFGEVKTLTLPASGVKVCYSSKYFHPSRDDRDAVYPHKEALLTSEDYFAGKDPVLELVLKMRDE
ncbi:hypothetical protein [Paenibacillus turpanensis]|uniref:hypothetical protein n=1 Tax=Paenibacillus turpanensis TaxID=2689078 RepID=UPI00140A9112|nr:hypothetical protein [Paenibacillus turpanensis]